MNVLSPKGHFNLCYAQKQFLIKKIFKKSCNLLTTNLPDTFWLKYCSNVCNCFRNLWKTLQISNKLVVFLRHLHVTSMLEVGARDSSVIPISRTPTYTPNLHTCGSKDFHEVIPVHDAHAFMFLSQWNRNYFPMITERNISNLGL